MECIENVQSLSSQRRVINHRLFPILTYTKRKILNIINVYIEAILDGVRIQAIGGPEKTFRISPFVKIVITQMRNESEGHSKLLPYTAHNNCYFKIYWLAREVLTSVDGTTVTPSVPWTAGTAQAGNTENYY